MMQVEMVYAILSRPDDEDPALREFGLSYFKFLDTDPVATFESGVKLAVWVRFSDVNQIETLQFHYPDAKLGPSHSFTEALIITESLEEAKRICKKIEHLFIDAEMKEMLQEDTLEDY